MNAIDLILRRAPVPALALGVAALAAGVVMQMQGIALPPMLGSVTAFGVMARIGGGIAILGLVLFALGELRGTPAAAPAGERPFPSDLPKAAPAPDLPPAVNQRVADWQRRLAEKSAAPAAAPPAPRAGIRARLHRAALAVVAIAFVGLLGLTVWNQIGPALTASAEPAAPAPVTVEDLALAVADAAIPDAPADRHWTELDLAPVLEWFAAKAALAMVGDRTAMLQLGMIAGGVLFLIVGSYVFMMLRRINGRRRRYSDIGAMGYN